MQLVWLAASCPIIITCGPADINPRSAQQRRPLFFFALFFLSHWTAPKTALSDWLLWRGSWKYPALWLDPGRLWFSFMETAVGERGVTEKEAWLRWRWWSFYQSLCYRGTCSPRNYVSLAKVWEVHKANLTMVFLHFSLGLNSIVVCLSLQLLIMMSILSYLLGSAWLLISSQHSSATLLVPAPHNTAETISLFSFLFFFFLSWTMTCFLLFVVTLPAESHQTKTWPALLK